MAEKKKEKYTAFLSQAEWSEENKVGGEFQYEEDWGEQMVGTVCPVVVRLGLECEQPVSCEVVEAAADLNPGLVTPWAGGLVGVAYHTQPRKLGKVYCSNRPAVLFHLPDGTSDWRILTGGSDLGITGVEVSPGGQLVWLERSLTASLFPGPHQAALRLMTLDQPGGTVREVVSHLQPEYGQAPGQPFCGLFSPHFSPRCWLDDQTLVVSGAQGETMVPIIVNINTGLVTVPSSPSCHGVEVLDVTADLILGKKSDPVTPAYLVVARAGVGVLGLGEPLECLNCVDGESGRGDLWWWLRIEEELVRDWIEVLHDLLARGDNTDDFA